MLREDARPPLSNRRRMTRVALLLALSACSPVHDPIATGWQRIADADGPITAPGVDRLWLHWAGHFERELPGRTYSGTYDEDDNASTLSLHADGLSWSGFYDLPPCPAPRKGGCMILYDAEGTRDLYRPLAPIGNGLWF